MIDIKIHSIHKSARIPQKKDFNDAGADLYTVDDTLVQAGKRAKVRTGLCFQVPIGYEMQVRPRSGLSISGMIGTKDIPLRDDEGNLLTKLYGLNGDGFDADVCLGTVDSGYRGEVHVIVANHSLYNFFIPEGIRIAQAVIAKHEPYIMVMVDALDKEGDRGGGFGHTGVL